MVLTGKVQKPNLFERTIAFFSPQTGLKRRAAREATRAYDSAQQTPASDWTSANFTSANSEIRYALRLLRNRARDVIRNSPFAKKALHTIVNNTVGAGILANIKSQDPRQQKAVQALWREWAETPVCDYNGQQNFYALQALAMSSVVESGEVIARIRTGKGKISLQLLECDYLDQYKDLADGCVQGVKLDDNDQIIGFWLFEKHPGDYSATGIVNFVDAKDVIYVRKIERPNQIHGVTWFHAVLEAISNFNDLQSITLVRQKVAACYSAFITSPESSADTVLNQTQLQASRQLDSALEPGMIRYLRNGEKMELAKPPQSEGYADFSKVTLRAIASGLGITYESLSGDFSNVNFSSGRMGALEFQRNLDVWRWHMIIPQFCEPAFAAFSKWCAIKGVSTDGCTVEWVPPARTMINPSEETKAISEQLRLGLTTLPRAISEMGYDYAQTIAEIKQSNADLDDAKIILDSDPRKVTQQGIAQMSDPTQLAAVTAHSMEPKPVPAPAAPSTNQKPKSPKKA